MGGWLFRQRSWLPLPIALALVLLPSPPLASPFLVWSGVALVASGELLRLWAVRHIGVVSRTRSDRLGPLVATGPFARLRNPLYLGNIALWVGFAASAGLVWLIPPIVLLLAFEYHAIVRWEERLLEGRLGDTYREYAARVPRWIPLASPVKSQSSRLESEVLVARYALQRTRNASGHRRWIPAALVQVSSLKSQVAARLPDFRFQVFSI